MNKIEITKDDVILFDGDSITDCHRDRSDLYSLAGYVKKISDVVPCVCYNRGISGNTSVQLLDRFEKSLIEVKPTVVSILIGINDTWRRFDSNRIIPWTDTYNSVKEVIKLAKKYTSKIILIEPFLIDCDPNKRCFREDLSPRLWAIKDVALEEGVTFVPLNSYFAELAVYNGPTSYSPDGVHPNDLGNEVIKDEWLKRVIIK